jgi:hypothetical protein
MDALSGVDITWKYIYIYTKLFLLNVALISEIPLIWRKRTRITVTDWNYEVKWIAQIVFNLCKCDDWGSRV